MIRRLILAALAALSSSAPALAAEPTFPDACAPAESRLTLAAIGDVMAHAAVQRNAEREGAFRPLWAAMEPWFAEADMLFANLETPLAEGYVFGRKTPRTMAPGVRYAPPVYTTYPLFNAHPQMAADLKASGVDLVSMANNHALDRGAPGLEATLSAVSAAGLASVGARGGDHVKPWRTILTHEDWRIGVVACTYSTNGIPDRHDQVLRCYRDRDVVLAEIRAATAEADAVVVLPHWGVEYKHSPIKRQRALARDMIDAGAVAVLGAHPHVVQPWEVVTAADGGRGVVAYSLGNFISSQGRQPRRLGAMAYVGLAKQGARVWLTGAKFLPLWTERGGGRRATAALSESSEATAYAAQLFERLIGAEATVTARPVRLSPHCPPARPAPEAGASEDDGPARTPARVVEAGGER